MKCTKCGYDFPQGTVCPVCGNDNLLIFEKMKWYKTLLVLLWFGFASNLASAASYFTGTMYEEFTGKLYELLPSIKILDVTFGVWCVVMAIYMVFVWSSLKNYKKNAPMLLVSLYVINAVTLIVYNFVFYSIVNGAETTIIYGEVQGIRQRYLDLNKIPFSASSIGVLIGYFVFAVINYKYFKKREHLFVN